MTDKKEQLIPPGTPTPAIICIGCQGQVHFKGDPKFEAHHADADGGIRMIPFTKKRPPA